MIPLASALAVEALATAARRRRRFRELDTPLAIDLVPRGVRVVCGSARLPARYHHAERLIVVRKGQPDLNGSVAHELGHHEIMTRRPGCALVGLDDADGAYLLHERCANWFMAAVLVRRAMLEGASVRRVARAVGVPVELVEVRRAQLRWLASPGDEGRRCELRRAHAALDDALDDAECERIADLAASAQSHVDAFASRGAA